MIPSIEMVIVTVAVGEYWHQWKFIVLGVLWQWTILSLESNEIQWYSVDIIPEGSVHTDESTWVFNWINLLFEKDHVESSSSDLPLMASFNVRFNCLIWFCTVTDSHVLFFCFLFCVLSSTATFLTRLWTTLGCCWRFCQSRHTSVWWYQPSPWWWWQCWCFF